jgi:hypothetical protein
MICWVGKKICVFVRREGDMEGNRERIKRLLNLWVEEEDDEGVMIELRKELERRGYIKREEVILRERGR